MQTKIPGKLNACIFSGVYVQTSDVLSTLNINWTEPFHLYTECCFKWNTGELHPSKFGHSPLPFRLMPPLYLNC